MAVFGITWYIYVIGPNKQSYEKQTPSDQRGKLHGRGKSQVAVATMTPGEPAPPQPLLSLLVRTGS